MPHPIPFSPEGGTNVWRCKSRWWPWGGPAAPLPAELTVQTAAPAMEASARKQEGGGRPPGAR